jgi:hypothetical protein
MSHGPRSPVACRDAYTTTGALSLVSQPSTGTWKPSTMSIVSQYAGRRNRPVCRNSSSQAQTASTAATAGTV